MAIRNIRVDGDDILRKVCKPVTKMNERTLTLIDDMFETMYEADGVGLAAPQVGILKRICVIDCGDNPILLINPKVMETSGEQTGQEGCLSVRRIHTLTGLDIRPGTAGVLLRIRHSAGTMVCIILHRVLRLVHIVRIQRDITVDLCCKVEGCILRSVLRRPADPVHILRKLHGIAATSHTFSPSRKRDGGPSPFPRML